MARDEAAQYHKRQAERFPQHACELPAHPDRVYPLLPPTATALQRLQHWWQTWIVGWRRSPALRLMRPSNYSLEVEQGKHARSVHWWVIHPQSRFLLMWQLFMIVVIFVTTIVFPFHYGFLDVDRPLGYVNSTGQVAYIPYLDDENKDARAYREILSRIRSFTTTTLGVGHGVYGLHMFVKACTGYHDNRRDVVIMAPKLIVLRYLRSWFVLDLLSLVQFRLGLDIITLFRSKEDGLFFYANYRPILVIQEICYVARLFRCRDSFIYTRNWCKNVGIRPIAIAGILLIKSYVIYLQYAAYLCYKIPLLVQGPFLFSENSKSWLNDPALGFLYIDGRYPLLRQYCLCLERAFSASGRIVPHNTFNRNTTEDGILLLCMMWAGTAFNIALFSILLQFVGSHASEDVELAKITNQVKTYMRSKHLPIYMQHRLLQFYDLKFGDRFYNERAILASMPQSIRETIRLASCRRMVAGSALFSGISRSLVKSVAARLEEQLYLPNDVVYAAGDAATALFFLSTGTVAVYSRAGEELGHLDDGAYFGEMGMVLHEHGRRRLVSVVALEVCEVYRLRRSVFRRIVKPIPRLYNRIRALALQRMALVDLYGEYDREVSAADVRAGGDLR